MQKGCCRYQEFKLEAGRGGMGGGGGGTELSQGAIRLSANLSISTQLIISSSIETDTVVSFVELMTHFAHLIKGLA